LVDVALSRFALPDDRRHALDLYRPELASPSDSYDSRGKF
jgi:hypothetical protein